MKVTAPELSLVVLIGPSGSGKSTFARKHFLATEILSSDHCRTMVSDDESDQTVTDDAFELLHFIAAKRLTRRRLTVVDATNIYAEDRKKLVALAREFHVLPVAIVFDLPEKLCQQRNKERPDRNFGPHVINQQRRALRRSLRTLKKEGFRHTFVFKTAEEVADASVERVKLWTDRRDEHGPFDIVGDVHGCCDELEELLDELGYEAVDREPKGPLESSRVYKHPEGRSLVFVGDLVDRGPRSLDTLRLAYTMVTSGLAICVPGNHDVKLLRKLRGKNVQITHGLAETLAELESLPAEVRPTFETEAARFLDGLVSHFLLDGGKLVVAHAGMREDMQGRASGAIREFALFGETTGETDEFGLPVRHNWAAEYRGNATVVYGHTPVPEPEWLNRTINIDTGCVFGGKLTALRYPEKELVSVNARRTYAESRRPFLPEEEQAPALSAQHQHDDVLYLEDVSGKRQIHTRLRSAVTVREGNATAALEVMTRFAADPKWLIYLPPTMSPSETSAEEGWLEHPKEAFSFYRNRGVPKVVCEEKHMGSRAIVVVCKNEETARERFGVSGDGAGICYTRTGRRFFDDRSLEAEFIDRVRGALEHAGMWETLETDWVCLDCELMPWSAKAQELLQRQYAAVGAAAKAAFAEVVPILNQAVMRDPETQALLEGYSRRAALVERYTQAYRRYCWSVSGIEGIKLAPFHILATEGKAHVDRDHVWHMETIRRFCEADDRLLLATPYRIADLMDPKSEEAAVRWWEELTADGGEGMVVKPLDFVASGKRGLLQPAVKCRGKEYLRIIYGPEYTLPEHLERLRRRGLSAKRSLALREFALGVESLERFVRKEPLRRVHECVFGVLALESEPVDPRL